MLQINNAQGLEIIGLTTRIFSILGVVPTTGVSNGSISIPFSSWAGAPEVFVVDTAPGFNKYPPIVSISGNSVVWNYVQSGNTYNMPVKIIIGVW